MHISDGILTPVWSLIWFALAAPFVILGVRKIQKKIDTNPVYMPVLAMMGAAVFIISVWHIPVPVTGSSSHPVGTPMSAIIVGPFATVVLTVIALFFQTFLGHGGLTTLGANTMSMGILGTFSGYLTFLLLRKLNSPLWVSAGFAGFVGDIITYIAAALELSLSLNPNAVLSHWALYTMGYLPTQLPLAVMEFIFTAGIVNYIAARRPDILERIGITGGV